MYKLVWLVGLFLACVIPPIAVPAGAEEQDLDIDPEFQDTPVWCWVAVSQMVFTHFDVANVNPVGKFQCGIVGAMAAATWAEACTYNCFEPQCKVPAGSASYLVQTLEEYPRRAATYEQGDQPRIKAKHVRHALDLSDVQSEIDDGNPIIAGISPAGRPPGGSAVAQHVALIVGYDSDDDELIVNDPFPFNFVGWNNPYVRAGATEIEDGQYRIAYDDFADELNWSETITVREAGTVSPKPLPAYCCTPMAGRLGPYPNPSPGGSPALKGQICYASNGWTTMWGRACY